MTEIKFRVWDTELGIWIGLHDQIQKRISPYYNHTSENLTLAQLRHIAEVLGIENKS